MKIEDYRETVIDMYVNKNMTTTSIAKELGCSSSGIGRLLNRNGIVLRHTPNEIQIEEAQLDEIKNSYIDGLSSIELAAKYGVCDNTIRKIVKMRGGEIRKAIRRSKVSRHDYFDMIDTPAKAYFLGWMISDGAVIESKTRRNRSKIISLEIHSNDIEILRMFADELGADASIIGTFKKREHSHIRFASEHMAYALEKYGITARKSWSTYVPSIDDSLIPHLIRGIFDGDGTVTNGAGQKSDTSYIRFAFYGSENICSDINNILHEQIGTPLHKVSKSTCFHVWFGGARQANLFYRYVYGSCGKFFLRRKRDKFEMLINTELQHENTEVIQKIAQGF